MGKWCLQASSSIFIGSSSNLLVTRTGIKSGTSLNSGRIDHSLWSYVPLSAKNTPYILSLSNMNIFKTSWPVLVKFMCSINGVGKRWHEQGSHRFWKTWKVDEKIPCMEKPWNLKINEKSWNFGMRLLFGCQYHSNFFLLPPLAQQFKNIKCSFLNRASQNRLLFVINKIFHVNSFTYATYIFLPFI